MPFGVVTSKATARYFSASFAAWPRMATKEASAVALSVPGSGAAVLVATGMGSA